MFIKAKLIYKMQVLEKHPVKLRALEPEDLDFLYSAENDSEFWEVSGTQTPFSKYLLKQYLKNTNQDIYEAKQLRLVVVDMENNENIGIIDLFDFDPQHKRAGIGILILKKYQQKGFAATALKLFVEYAFSILQLHQIYAHITTGNQNSIRLFEKLNFERSGTKKDWIRVNDSYKDVYLYQLLNNSPC